MSELAGICHVVSHIDREASGPSYSVPSLAKSLTPFSQRVLLATLKRGQPNLDLSSIEHLAFEPSPNFQALGRSRDMKRWFKAMDHHNIDIVHSHGLWMMPNIYPSIMPEGSALHIVTPRGTLDPAALSYSKLKKKAFWLLAQNKALRSADAFHATSDAEVEQIRQQGLRQPIILSPNGIDIPEPRQITKPKRRKLVFLSRLHEKKGLDMLIEAWQSLEPQFPDWDLDIYGTGSDRFVEALKADIKSRHLENVTLHPPMYGEEKLDIYTMADLFILPTRGENFGMVVAEALASGTPAMTTNTTPWIELPKNQCGWVCDPNVRAINDSLRAALPTRRIELNEMGLNGRIWMEKTYSWEAIGKDMAKAYRWLKRGGEKPSNVIVA